MLGGLASQGRNGERLTLSFYDYHQSETRSVTPTSTPEEEFHQMHGFNQHLVTTIGREWSNSDS